MEELKITVESELVWFDDSFSSLPIKDREIHWRMYADQPIDTIAGLSIKIVLDIEIYPIGKDELILGNIKARMNAIIVNHNEQSDTLISLSMLLIEFAKTLHWENQSLQQNFNSEFLSNLSRQDVLNALSRNFD